MSAYRNSVLAFVHVIESQSHLITPSDWVELNQLTVGLSEDDEEISNRIEDWLEQENRSHILQAYEEQLEKLDSADSIDLEKDLGVGRSGRNSNPFDETEPPNESSLGLLNNAIQKNSPLSDN